MTRDGEGSIGCRHKYPERSEMRVPTVEGEGVAQLWVGFIGPREVVRCFIDAIFGLVWGPGYPHEQVGAVLPLNFSEGRPGYSFQ